MAIKDPVNNVTRRLLDGDRVIRVDECSTTVCASADETFYTYEVTGEVRAVFHPVNQDSGVFGSSAFRTRFDYDSLGRLISVSDPDGGDPDDGKREFAYDLAGNLISSINVEDQELRYWYDSRDRVAWIDRAPFFSQIPAVRSAEDAKISYDDKPSTGGYFTGRRASVEDNGYSYVYRYDAFGRLSREELTTKGRTLLTSFSYDLLGRIKSLNYPTTNSQLIYKYDGAHLTQICGPQAGNPSVCNEDALWLVDATYDDVGRPSDLALLPGVLHYGYQEYRQSSATFTGGASSVGFTYTCDDAGNLERREDAASNELTADYTYDARNRVETFTPHLEDPRTFVYDAVGNLKAKPRADGTVQQQHFDTPGSPYRLAGVTPAGQGRLNFGYDADGNRTHDPIAGQYYSYDAEGRLIKVGTAQGGEQLASHGYDLDGRRIYSVLNESETHIYAGDLLDFNTAQNAVSVMYVYGFGQLLGTRHQKYGLRLSEVSPGFLVLPEVAPELLLLLSCGAATWLLVVMGSGAALRRRPLAGSVSLVLVVCIATIPAHAVPDPSYEPVVRFYVTDLVGSAVVAFDSAGNQKARRLLDPYGEVVYEWDPDSMAEWYGGRPKEGVTGLFDLHARWYDARTGAFLSVDPMIGDLADPQQHNHYAYARGNPVTLADPTGLTTCSIVTDEFVIHCGGGAGDDGLSFGDGPSFGVSIGFDTYSGFGGRGPGPLAGHTNFDLGGGFEIVSGSPLIGAGGDSVSFNFPKSNSSQSQQPVVVNSTLEAFEHYFGGSGEPAELGSEVKDAIVNSADQLYRYDRIRTGRTPSLESGVYGVDVELDGAFFVGDTPVRYQTLCRTGTCTTTFTSTGDGFWDLVRDVDAGGPSGEIPGGTPYPFIPFSWERTFRDPRSIQP